MTETEQFESIFFKVLFDLNDYLNELTLVGGWLPFVYSKFLWNNFGLQPITTVDVDFGFDKAPSKTHKKTIFETLSDLDYTERHFRINKSYPVVLYKEGKMPVEFITYPDIKNDIIENLIGRQIYISKLDKFDFLLRHRISIEVKNKKSTYKIFCPNPSAFLYHKAATFTDREEEHKQAKDLYYIYFILRYAPDLENIFKEIIKYKKEKHFNEIPQNINKYFERKTSQGCLMVEKENGPDAFIDNLRNDIYDRFKNLYNLLK